MLTVPRYTSPAKLLLAKLASAASILAFPVVISTSLLVLRLDGLCPVLASKVMLFSMAAELFWNVADSESVFTLALLGEFSPFPQLDSCASNWAQPTMQLASKSKT